MKNTVATFTEVMTCKIYRDSRWGGKLVVRSPMGVPVVCNVDAHYTSSKCIRDNNPNEGVSSLIWIVCTVNIKFVIPDI